MTVTITYTGAKPTIDADEDTWGDELNNDALGPIKTDLDALADQVNTNKAKADAALPKAGGTMEGPLRLGSPTAINADSAGYLGAPIVEFSANKTLSLADAGKAQCLTGTNARDLTIPPVGSVGFPPSTIIPLISDGAVINIKRGSGVSLRVAGQDTNKDCKLAAFCVGSLFHRSNNVWILSGTGVS